MQRLAGGPATAAELARALDVSQPTLSRALARLAARVVHLGRARATRYALRRAVRELPPDVPLFRVDAAGAIARIGTMAPIEPGGWWHQEAGGAGAVYAGLPWFMTDMRAQGFLGRRFAAAAQLRGLPQRLADWSETQHFYALAVLGEDVVGNLLLGEESHERWQRRRRDAAEPLPPRRRRAAFAAEAQRMLAHGAPGSSAGGEQQKFTATVADARGEVRHVIVKFSPPLADADGRRWGDLLLLEHLALRTLAALGVAAAHSEVVEDRTRLYLEVRRFDRVGPQGRRGLVSLGALDDEFVGQRRSWSATAEALHGLGWIGAEDARRAAWLEGFGRLIANTDMHFGNLSLIHEGQRPLALAPAYDMLPMAYAPGVELPPLRAMEPPVLTPVALEQADSLVPAALEFWRAAAAEPRLSAPMRKLAGANAAVVARAFAR
ncbi:MAG TPA: type II toxin-antitoxin system HipA family toxin YjjJ [Nevskia sp.]|nr:type II toxin-antitoxin system HipA family toxin YjjJ [Nevskia sp.]